MWEVRKECVMRPIRQSISISVMGWEFIATPEEGEEDPLSHWKGWATFERMELEATADPVVVRFNVNSKPCTSGVVSFWPCPSAMNIENQGRTHMIAAVNMITWRLGEFAYDRGINMEPFNGYDELLGALRRANQEMSEMGKDTKYVRSQCNLLRNVVINRWLGECALDR
jgi:hypothetical protein